MIPGELLLYLRVAVLLLFGGIGIFAFLKAWEETGLGIALLGFGIYVCVIWIALK